MDMPVRPLYDLVQSTRSNRPPFVSQKLKPFETFDYLLRVYIIVRDVVHRKVYSGRMLFL